jgi:hypothetical protein
VAKIGVFADGVWLTNILLSDVTHHTIFCEYKCELFELAINKPARKQDSDVVCKRREVWAVLYRTRVLPVYYLLTTDTTVVKNDFIILLN